MADSLLHDLYTALKGNALFVHVTADTMRYQSVVDATSLIRQIEQNPSNLFGITLGRIKDPSLGRLAGNMETYARVFTGRSRTIARDGNGLKQIRQLDKT